MLLKRTILSKAKLFLLVKYFKIHFQYCNLVNSVKKERKEAYYRTILQC